MRYAILTASLLLLAGCVRDEHKQVAQQKQQTERTHYAGSITVPIPSVDASGAAVLTPMAIPVDLTVDRSLVETGTVTASTHTETTMPPWAGQLLAALGGKAVSVASGGGLGAGGIAGLVTAGVTILAGATGWSKQKARADAEKRRADYHEADAEEGWKLATGKPAGGADA